MSYSIPVKDERGIVRGLVPVCFEADLAARKYQLKGTQYNDYAWFEYRRADGLAPGTVLQTIADLLTSVLREMHNQEVPQEIALKSLGLRVFIVRGYEAPREVDLMTTFSAATNTNTVANPQQQQIQVQNNARLGSWVEWGILQKDPAKFRVIENRYQQPEGQGGMKVQDSDDLS
ncbi:hypothetical protein PG996_004444 [Apiospora saccharicola]|uniref:Uncharacterized protein n=1 Tax=Apiospora saccharicola TaxID=335842 RepID=A0ABR1W7W9_9PEZI